MTAIGFAPSGAQALLAVVLPVVPPFDHRFGEDQCAVVETDATGGEVPLMLRGVPLEQHCPVYTLRAQSCALTYSTVTDFARLRGWSTSVPFSTATW